MTDKRQRISVPVGESPKIMIDFAVTSDRPPKEILNQLDSFGIEWYVTDLGNLMIRSWQIAAENFVPAERIAEIRQTHAVPNDADALEWVSAHLEDLNKEYAGNWIAISNNAVVAASTTLQELLSLIEAQNIQNPFLTQVPQGPTIWETAYANEDL